MKGRKLSLHKKADKQTDEQTENMLRSFHRGQHVQKQNADNAPSVV